MNLGEEIDRDFLEVEAWAESLRTALLAWAAELKTNVEAWSITVELAGAADAAIAAHVAEADPHPTYLTQAEADALYLTQAEADALYSTLASTDRLNALTAMS